MTGMVEKPPPGTEPSNLFISGRYILQPEIFDALAAHEQRRRRRDPAHRRHVRLLATQGFHALEYDGTPTTAATSWACCAPTSPMR